MDNFKPEDFIKAAEDILNKKTPIVLSQEELGRILDAVLADILVTAVNFENILPLIERAEGIKVKDPSADIYFKIVSLFPENVSSLESLRSLLYVLNAIITAVFMASRGFQSSNELASILSDLSPYYKIIMEKINENS